MHNLLELQKGDDDVARCILNSDGTLNIIRMYNSGKSSSLMSSSESSIVLTNKQTSYLIGVFLCAFFRDQILLI